MNMYSFTVTICGTVFAESEDEAASKIMCKPLEYGELTFDDIRLVPEPESESDA